MKAQAQYTIHTLNDVVASTTAPSNPYKGQLWVNTSYSPPRTYVYNGSAWKEQNGTDTLRSNISTLTTKSNTMRSDLDGLTSTVSAVTTRVETVEDDLGVVEETILDVQTSVSELEQTASSIALRVSKNETNISSLSVDVSGLKTRVSNAEGDISSLEQTATSLTTRIKSAEGNITTLTTSVNGLKTRVTNAEGDISTLEQTTDELSATVATKVDENGGAESSFGWSLTSSGFYLYSNGYTVMSVTESGLTVSGDITATSGSLSELYILGSLYFGDEGQYFLNPNYNNGSWYIYLPKFRVDDTSAYFSGTLQAPGGTIGGFTIGTSSIYKTKTSYSSTTAGVYVGTDGIGLGAGTFYVTSAGAITAKSGNIGGFTIGTTSIYKTKTAYNNTTAGVYLGTDGIGLGAGTFYVTSAGALTATSATITGTINATGGTIKNLTIDGKLTFGGNSSYYINANHNDSSWYIRLPGMSSDEASGTVFSGKLSAPTGTIGGWNIGTATLHCTVKNSDGTIKGTGFQAPNAGIWAIAVGYDSESSWANAPFRVNHSGAMYASNAFITGVITNADDDGWGVKLIENRIEFYQNSTKVSEMYAGSGYYRANMSTTSNGLYISSLLRVGGDLVCGKCLGISTGNGIYVSGKLALTMGQVKVQTNTAVQRYLLFYCGILVGIGSSKYSGISDYSASTY